VESKVNVREAATGDKAHVRVQIFSYVECTYRCRE
jgi:hypothetical protein